MVCSMKTNTAQNEIKIGNIVQITDGKYNGCITTVTGVTHFGFWVSIGTGQIEVKSVKYIR